MRPVFTRPHGIVHDLLLSANHNFTSNQLRPPTDLFRPNMPRLPAAESPASFDVEEPIKANMPVKSSETQAWNFGKA